MKKSSILKSFILLSFTALIILSGLKFYQEKRLLEKIIERLLADSRTAEAMVSSVKQDPESEKTLTTIKFLEYDTKLKPLPVKYFTFSGNILQFQSLVIRFDDFYIKKSHPLKGKSAYIFMKVFALSDKGAEVFEINKVNEIPSGYRVNEARNNFEKKLWEKFWDYALNPKEAKRVGIKNAQIEAPGTKFIPGILYTIKIEHDGGMRIDAKKLPEILRGERIDF
ncbi:MAG: hypothetical protein DRP74_05125 [Candidatus Omnitrophota bacterium]|nr:MAG: hypothetical protein DRP74_05125 [Candidatus Omnitrophota bacterium]